MKEVYVHKFPQFWPMLMRLDPLLMRGKQRIGLPVQSCSAPQAPSGKTVRSSGGKSRTALKTSSRRCSWSCDISADSRASTYTCDAASRFPSNLFWHHKAKPGRATENAARLREQAERRCRSRPDPGHSALCIPRSASWLPPRPGHSWQDFRSTENLCFSTEPGELPPQTAGMGVIRIWPRTPIFGSGARR